MIFELSNKVMITVISLWCGFNWNQNFPYVQPVAKVSIDCFFVFFCFFFLLFSKTLSQKRNSIKLWQRSGGAKVSQCRYMFGITCPVDIGIAWDVGSFLRLGGRSLLDRLLKHHVGHVRRQRYLEVSRTDLQVPDQKRVIRDHVDFFTRGHMDFFSEQAVAMCASLLILRYMRLPAELSTAQN